MIQNPLILTSFGSIVSIDFNASPSDMSMVIIGSLFLNPFALLKTLELSLSINPLIVFRRYFQLNESHR